MVSIEPLKLPTVTSFINCSNQGSRIYGVSGIIFPLSIKTSMAWNDIGCFASDGTSLGRHIAGVSCLTAGRSCGNTKRPSIYFLAGAHPAHILGNPRQVNAYDYPSLYGPRSPSFARASLYRSDSATQLFISGTASVVGHQSQHKGLADLQLEKR